MTKAVLVVELEYDEDSDELSVKLDKLVSELREKLEPDVVVDIRVGIREFAEAILIARDQMED